MIPVHYKSSSKPEKNQEETNPPILPPEIAVTILTFGEHHSSHLIGK